MEMKLELVTVPVTDVDRAKAFYVEKAGFVADHDHTVGEGLRFVQLTPPGSACSIAIGTGLTDTAPGTANCQLVVADIHAARDELVGRGLDVGEVQRFDWGWFVFFADPDGNRWAVQQIPPGTEAADRGLSSLGDSPRVGLRWAPCLAGRSSSPSGPRCRPTTGAARPAT